MGFKAARPNLPMAAVWAKDICPASSRSEAEGAAASPLVSLAKAPAFCVLSSAREKIAITSSQPPRGPIVGPKTSKRKPACDLHFLSAKKNSPLNLVKKPTGHYPEIAAITYTGDPQKTASKRGYHGGQTIEIERRRGGAEELRTRDGAIPRSIGWFPKRRRRS